MPTIHRIVVLRGDAAAEAIRILDRQGVDAAINYLAQWDKGDCEEVDERSAGAYCHCYETDDGYILAHSVRVGVIALARRGKRRRRGEAKPVERDPDAPTFPVNRRSTPYNAAGDGLGNYYSW